LVVVDPLQLAELSLPLQLAYEYDCELKVPGTVYVYSVSLSCRSTIFTSNFCANAKTGNICLQLQNPLSTPAEVWQ